MIYQLHIHLLEIEPPIWRRIQVSGNVTLYRLSLIIQRAMGWTNNNINEFEIDSLRYGDTSANEWDELLMDLKDTTLFGVTKKVHDRFTFIYDLGDNWQHSVTVEKIFQEETGGKYNICIDGERSCPPEDVGGAASYNEFLYALNDHEHVDHKSYVEWIGSFDPEMFDKEEATRLMRKR